MPHCIIKQPNGNFAIFSTSERQAAISRRLLHGERGLGYWAAVDAQEAQKRRAIAAMKKAAENAKK